MRPAAPPQAASTILIVDDIPANVGVLVDYLEDNGFRVVVAQDGAEGLKRAEFARPDLILLDVMMPGMDGFETCRRLKAEERTRDIPVIFMTAMTEAGEKVNAFGVGAVDYVTKPFEIEEVLARVKTHLSLREMRRQLEKQNELLQQEIHVRLQTERALRLTQFSVDHATVAVIWIAPNGSFAYANEAACQLLRYTRAEMMALGMYDIEVGVTQENWALHWAYIKERRYFGNETRVRTKDGAVLPLESTINYLEFDGREYAIAFVRDVSERKRAEQSLHESYQKLKESNRKLEEMHQQLLQSEKLASIGQLAAGMAHEINNPIAFVHANLGTFQEYVAGLLQLIALYERAEPFLAGQADLLAQLERLRTRIDLAHLRSDVNDLLAESQDGVQRVRRIVQDLKDFSRVGEAERQRFELHPGLDSTLNIVNSELKQKAEVVKEYGKLPVIEGVPAQINQVFLNLLVNAGQAIVNEGEGRIVIRTGCEDGWVWIEVEDNGVGIPADNMTRIFEPFFTTKPVGMGTGLGLSLSYGIVAQHCGRIDVASKVGKGSTFRVWLPVHAPEAEV
ncbi:MAG TPA: response regulator [Burkholderiaceae bacterium]